jgi:serine protease Do
MMSKNIRRTLISGALLGASLLGSFTVAAKTLYQLPQGDALSPPLKSSPLLEELSRGVSEIAANASKALVFISVSKTMRGYPQGYVDPFDLFGMGQRPEAPPPKQEGLGSGFIIDVEKGYVLTNNHVIEGADEITVKLANGEVYDGKVIGRDPNTDVAVVQIAGGKFKRENIGALMLGDSDSATVGSFVVALGAPFGLEASVSFGVVSAIGRGPLQLTQLGNFIQTDTAINPGNSGGPLVRIPDGKVIGMNTAIFSRSGGYQGIGFAVPINLAREVALSIINDGGVVRGFIGVQFRPLQAEWVESLGLPKGTTGAVVVEVAEGGPAEKSGIKANDVIVEIDNKAIKNTEELVNAIGLMKPGTKTVLTLWREGKKRTVNITIGDWPGSKELLSEKNEKGDTPANSFGLEMSLVKFEGKWALRVEQVLANSPAARAGMQAGDMIFGINGYSNNKELMDKFLKGQLKDTVLLLTEREMEDRRSGKKVRERFLVALKMNKTK